MLDHGILDSVSWCDTRDMLADGMTKGTISRAAIVAAMHGRAKINHGLKTWSPRRTLSRSDPASRGSAPIADTTEAMQATSVQSAASAPDF